MVKTLRPGSRGVAVGDVLVGVTAVRYRAAARFMVAAKPSDVRFATR